MIATSAAYKDLVYGRGNYALFARQFLPTAVITLIDNAAQKSAIYEFSSSSPVSNIAQLTDFGQARERPWGMLEDYQFALDGHAMLLPQNYTQQQSYQNGWWSEEMSDADGNFSSIVQYHIIFGSFASTGGHLLVFDPSYDSVPKDFDIVYFRNGVEISREEIRNNETHLISGGASADRYNQITISFYSTTLPYRRIHLIEDMIGIFLEYGKGNIVSLTVTQEIDPLSEEITTGEIDLTVSNAGRTLDILNSSGISGYLQQYQRVSVGLELVYPDQSKENIQIGQWEMIEWDASGMEANFIIQDPTVLLSRHNFIRNKYRQEIDLYTLASEIFDDAGVTDYKLPPKLKNYKVSSAGLPVATHKECLRLIAQATMCVLLPRTSGQLEMRHLDTLKRAYNTLQNATFQESELGVWSTENVEWSDDYILFGDHSARPRGTFNLQQAVQLAPGHKYYTRFYVYVDGTTQDIEGTAQLFIGPHEGSVDILGTPLLHNEWVPISGLITSEVSESVLSFRGNISKDILRVDGFMLIDLTDLYGEGNEPDASWCESHLVFVDDTLLVPPYKQADPVVYLGYNTLSEPPKITRKDPISAVSVSSFREVVDEEVSEVYKATHTIKGTDTITIEYNSPITDNLPEVVLSQGTLVKAEFFTSAAILTVRARGDVEVIVRGHEVSFEETVYTRDHTVDLMMVKSAPTHEVANPLVTSFSQVQDLLAFVTFWITQKHEYDFNWRQDPSIELLDYIQVHDDFSNDNVILHISRDLDYSGGVLSGASRGIIGQ